MIRALAWDAYLALHLPGQKNVPFLPWPTIERRQSRRLRSTVRYAYRHVPYYRETMTRLGISPGQIQRVQDLTRLPIIDRDDLRRDPEYFVSRSVKLSGCLQLLSSGSCGTPSVIWHNPAALFQNAAHGERDRSNMVRALGRWSGHRETVIVSAVAASQRKIQEFVRDTGFFPRGMRVERQYILLSDPPARNLALINEFRPDLLYSYGSYLEMLFGFIRRTGPAWHRPKAVLYNSDHLSSATRLWLREECGIPVFSVYGAVEALKIGFGCELDDGYHVNSDLYPVRIVDRSGKEVEPGQPGEVVLSNLVNRATVLLNYRLGDLASASPTPCPCGRAFPLISSPVGRADQISVLPDGSEVHPILFHDICLAVPGILQYQVRQIQPAVFRISLVAPPETDRKETEGRIRELVRTRLGEGVTAEVRFVEELERTSGGKTLAVISLRQGSATLISDDGPVDVHVQRRIQ
jgi:phenylacetate-CoA ligase